MKPKIALFLLSLACAASCAGATLVITPSGYYSLTLNSQGEPVLSKFTDVLRLSDDPTQDPDPDPDPDLTLSEKVAQWAIGVDEPAAAEAQGLMMQMIAEQGRRGTFNTKSRMVEFTRTAIPKTLETVGSQKRDQWQRVWDDLIFLELRKLEDSGRMDTVLDMVAQWEEVADGFKTSVSADWNVQFASADGELVILGEPANRPILEKLLKILLQLLLEWLTNNPLGSA